MGTLSTHIRKGFTIDPNFEAVVDGGSKVVVTAVLDRTCVVEYPEAMWAGRVLVRLDRVEVNPEVLHYHENQVWVKHLTYAERGRKGREKAAPKVKAPPDPNQCPGSHQSADGDAKHKRGGEWAKVRCSVCGSPTYTYHSKRRGGRLRSAHLRPVGTESEDPIPVTESSKS